MNPEKLGRETSTAKLSPRRIGQMVTRALYTELMLYPKPGLVSPVDQGSHKDMDAATFLRSLFALRGYFCDIAASAADGGTFPHLQQLGIAAEAQMLQATGGVNTHRGAIFTLGLLAAAAAHLGSRGEPNSDQALAETVRERWGTALSMPGQPTDILSHGEIASERYGAGGARAEAAAGFPLLFSIALPTLRDTLEETGSKQLAQVQTLFALMARLEDTNLLYRGGVEGLTYVRRAAHRFLASDGALNKDWESHAIAIHRAFVRRRLSPGGSADLLAAAWFVHLLNRG
jgi:triphosphoribosyl-dephospho-CoA synthase